MSRIRSWFKGIRWRYLVVALITYMLCSIGFGLFTGRQFTAAISAILNDWPIYLTLVVAYVLVSKLKG